MGVDYTAFVCWGQRVSGDHRKLINAFEEQSALLSKHGVGYAEYGSRNYGGDGGLVLTVDSTYHGVDFDDAPLFKALPKDRDWNRVDGVMRIQEVIYELRKKGVEISGEGEVGWLVCGHVW
jgi:hypothetical protein